MREIKFRAKLLQPFLGQEVGEWFYWDIKSGFSVDEKLIDITTLSEYTGLKDKNGVTYIYEGDIIDNDGNVIGNQYETPDLLKEKTNLLIQGFGTKTWCKTYKEAVGRGCNDSE